MKTIKKYAGLTLLSGFCSVAGSMLSTVGPAVVGTMVVVTMVACGPDKPAPCAPYAVSSGAGCPAQDGGADDGVDAPGVPPGVVISDAQDGSAFYDGGPGAPFEEDRSPEALAATTPCARACSRLASFGCPEARTPVGGRTCIETCHEIAQISSYDPKCVMLSTSVVAIRKCPKVKCTK